MDFENSLEVQIELFPESLVTVPIAITQNTIQVFLSVPPPPRPMTFAPRSVNVSEGIPAVVCITGTLLMEDIHFFISIYDISTCK